MARRTKLKVEVHETFYGEAEVRGKDTVLWVLLLPAGWWDEITPQKEFKLVILGWQIPVPGFAVVGTKRWVIVDKEWYLSQRLLGATIDAGPPKVTDRITFNSDESQGGRWMGEAYEEWPVKLIKVRRRSRWERMRGGLGLSHPSSRKS